VCVCVCVCVCGECFTKLLHILFEVWSLCPRPQGEGQHKPTCPSLLSFRLEHGGRFLSFSLGQLRLVSFFRRKLYKKLNRNDHENNNGLCPELSEGDGFTLALGGTCKYLKATLAAHVWNVLPHFVSERHAVWMREFYSVLHFCS
jgi:hypothetical protein